MNWILDDMKASFWSAWRFWRPLYITAGVTIAFCVLLVLADLAWRASP